MDALKGWARLTPDKPALIMAESGAVLTYGELDRRAAHTARWLVSIGLQAGDCIAILLSNDPRVFELAWAAQRAGLYYVPINYRLTVSEAEFILKDSEAKLLFASEKTLPLARAIAADPGGRSVMRVLLDGREPGFIDYDEALAGTPEGLDLPARPIGRDMLYSSGTTGRPKGIRRPMVPHAERDQPDKDVRFVREHYGFDEDSIYLSTAPFYHAAPMRFIMRTMGGGGTCVAMARFDAEKALAAIDQHRVTHSQWVPTMLSRLLQLSQDIRDRYDLSSMRAALHAAAPCPPHVKQAMLDWWGDILYEYYGGSEGFGVTTIDAKEWRAHPGSVGRAKLGTIHIVDDTGQELPAGEIGAIYFSGGPPFQYHNDPEKTRQAYNDRGWATYGDMGHVDRDGYLYLSDRRADLILSGGANLYPAEIENVLLERPGVADAGVIGLPDADMGEVPIAIVQLDGSVTADAAAARGLVEGCRGKLGTLKLPRRVVFETALPRLPTGKLLRRELKERFRNDPTAGFAVEASAAVKAPRD